MAYYLADGTQYSEGSAAPLTRSARRYVIEKARCLFRSTIPATTGCAPALE